MTCERCFTPLDHGAHGEGLCPYEPRSKAHAIVADDIPGGMWVENGFPEPVKVYSHSEHRALLAARGLEIKARWSGPNDKHLKRWDVPCAQTLKNAAELLTRGTKRKEKPQAESFPITVTEMTETFRYRMEP